MIDGFVLRKVTDELQSLRSERLRQIYQYEKFVLYLYFESSVVRICLQPLLQHVCLTQKEDFSDHHPSNFVMLLRSRLRNGKLIEIDQHELDRILFFTIDKIDEVGQRHEYKLYVELFGTHSNLVLVEDGIVIDCFREVKSTARQVVKGEPYTLPTRSLNPLKIDYADFQLSSFEKVSKYIQSTFYGFSKILVNEILHRAGVSDLPISALSEKEKALLKHAFFSIIDDFYKSQVCVYSLEEKFILSCIPLTMPFARKLKCFESPSAAVDGLYQIESKRQKAKKLSEELRKAVEDMIQKEEKLIESVENEIKECEKMNEYFKFGELLKYASESDRQGDQALVFDWYTGQKVCIPLVKGKSVKESSQHYFELYKKMKEKLPVLKAKLDRAKSRLDYLKNLKKQIESSEDLEVLEGIKEELFPQKKRSDQRAEDKPGFRIFQYEGFTIVVGRNNKQNDELVRKSSSKDIWLHAQGIPGAHVVIKVQDKVPPESVIRFAAGLAAYYSNARYSSNVPVDYTEVKNVYKPKGFPPGKVLYTNFSTVFVDPLSVEQFVQKAD
ncbi:Rqc2 family fibronectin-binding protein [Pseudothermotoga thermarum]|uniref:Fibronectin-binding A domain protein n=1 Tax=Pseudothermotoga thermarum DSM 5069 TaxID=688269 RepID=F7YW91_9THEM|nr:NFACT family protein [Pseudothermotoga thermarum]AEH51863.1 Fibronectin-binding A domain protein [Pseudothermotoga thermarum DSM 5069]